MARFTLPSLLAGLSDRIGGATATRNARAELQLTERRNADAAELIQRVVVLDAAARPDLAATTGQPNGSAPSSGPRAGKAAA